MHPSFTLVDGLALQDLRVFLARAARVENGSVRLIASGGVLAVYAAVLYPAGLLDETPTVLGLRTFAIDEATEFDVVVPVASLTQRVEGTVHPDAAPATPEAPGDPVEVTMPMQVQTVTWAAISPPRGGWRALDSVPAAPLEQAAAAGIDQVAAAVPGSLGQSLVQRVRSEVWGRPMDEADHLPAGAAFALVSLGFLGTEAVQVFSSGPWTRLTTPRGHVLVKQRAWTLAR